MDTEENCRGLTQHGAVMVMTNLNHSGTPFLSSDVPSFLELHEDLALYVKLSKFYGEPLYLSVEDNAERAVCKIAIRAIQHFCYVSFYSIDVITWHSLMQTKLFDFPFQSGNAKMHS